MTELISFPSLPNPKISYLTFPLFVLWSQSREQGSTVAAALSTEWACLWEWGGQASRLSLRYPALHSRRSLSVPPWEDKGTFMGIPKPSALVPEDEL